MSTGETWTLGRRPALDGLRGVAILLVVAQHAHVPGFDQAGAVGVTVFFTLSGFLITSLLLEERRQSGRVNLASFYTRRARRLFPALFVFVAAMLALGWATVGDAAAVIGYVGNWSRIIGHDLGPMNHTWSLSVEEQFYLAWPLLFLFLARFPRWVMPSAVALVVLGVVGVRFALWVGGGDVLRLYAGTDVRADGLLAGCLLAAFLHRRAEGSPSRGLAWGGIAAAAVVGVASSGEGGLIAAATMIPLATVAVLAGVARGSYVGWLTWGPLVLVGQRSYGLYLWHYPLVTLAAVAWGPAGIAVAAAAAWGLALASWRYVEEPFLRASSSRHATASPPATTCRAGSAA